MTEEPHTSLIQMAKGSVELSFDGLTGSNQDVKPEMTWRTGYDDSLGIMVVDVDADTPEELRALGELMLATLIIQQAREATFAHATWSVDEADMDAWIAEGRPSPAEFSRRVEEIFMFHVTPDGEALHRARVTRYDDKPPTMGKWKLDDGGGQVVGQFRQSVVYGVRLGRKIPPALAEGLRNQMETHGPEKVLAAMIQSYRMALAESEEQLRKEG
jgi:hypothetical protein